MKPRADGGRAAVLGLALALGLTGCGGDDPKPGPDAGTAACTALLERVPDQVLDRQRTTLEVTGAAAWGDPAIVLRCGVPPPGPSGNCLDVDGVDWIFAETEDVFRFVTHDRVPAVEVTIPTSIDRTTAPAALADLGPAVQPLPKSGVAACQ